MILLLGGTREAGDIARHLKEAGKKFLVTVVSDYGAELLKEQGVDVMCGELDQPRLEQVIDEQAIRAVIDATHPYADKITQLAIEAAKHKGVAYYRYQRPPAVVEGPMITRAATYEEAALLAASKAGENGGTMFLTIGSRRLQPFLRQGRQQGVRVVARVLPDAKVLDEVVSYGLSAKDVVAIQGPFSLELNKAMYLHYNAAVVVTKDAGLVGGTDTKLAAAAELQIPVVVVSRPQSGTENVFYEIEQLLRSVEDE